MKEIKRENIPRPELKALVIFPFVVPRNNCKFFCDVKVMTKHYPLQVLFVWRNYVRRFQMEYYIKMNIFTISLLYTVIIH